MASNFTEFLNELSTNPATLARYKDKPDEVLKESKLTPAEKTLLLSGDAKLILAAFYNDPENKATPKATQNQQVAVAKYITIVHP